VVELAQVPVLELEQAQALAVVLALVQVPTSVVVQMGQHKPQEQATLLRAELSQSVFFAFLKLYPLDK